MSADEPWGIEDDEEVRTDQQAIKRAETLASSEFHAIELKMRAEGWRLIANCSFLQVYKRGEERIAVSLGKTFKL